MVWLLAAGLALAGSVRALVEVDGDEVRVLDVVPVAGEAVPQSGADLAIVDDDGEPLLAVGLHDPRLRSVIHPHDHHEPGTVAVRERGVAWVELPWPEAAVAVQGPDGLRVSPRPQPLAAPPPGDAVLVRGTGDAANRLDLVFLADGYTEAELSTFADDVERVTQYLLSIEPYASYGELFNVWRIDRASAESGSQLPGEAPLDTAYGCYYGCAGLDRLVCCDDDAVASEVAQTLPEAEGVMVLVNEDTYGGSGGFTYATSTARHPDGDQIAAHEIGHTLVGLWDEYPYGIEGDAAFDGESANCSATEGNPPWDEWMSEPGIGTFPVCSFSNYYRPTEWSCMMNTLQDGYCPVCRQEAIFAIYARLPGLVNSITPAPGETVVAKASGPSLVFEIDANEPTHGLQYDWYVDGELHAEDTPRFDLRCSGANGELMLKVSDTTPWVRDDPYWLTWQDVGPWKVRSGPPCDSWLSCSGCSSTEGGMGLAWLAGLVVLARRRRW